MEKRIKELKDGLVAIITVDDNYLIVEIVARNGDNFYRFLDNDGKPFKYLKWVSLLIDISNLDEFISSEIKLKTTTKYESFKIFKLYIQGEIIAELSIIYIDESAYAYAAREAYSRNNLNMISGVELVSIDDCDFSPVSEEDKNKSSVSTMVNTVTFYNRRNKMGRVNKYLRYIHNGIYLSIVTEDNTAYISTLIRCGSKYYKPLNINGEDFHYLKPSFAIPGFINDVEEYRFICDKFFTHPKRYSEDITQLRIGSKLKYEIKEIVDEANEHKFQYAFRKAYSHKDFDIVANLKEVSVYDYRIARTLSTIYSLEYEKSNEKIIFTKL